MGDSVSVPAGDAELRAVLHLSLLPGIGDRRLAQLRRLFGSARAAVDAGADAFARAAGRPALAARGSPTVCQRVAQALTAIERKGLVARVAGGPGYPAGLHELSDPPQVLFVRGDEAVTQRLCVAMVGSRKATEYGLRCATAIASTLAAHGVVVVSGLALGIDQAAHEGALAGGGQTLAVLGTGIDVAYPASNRRLMNRIADNGLIVSEFLPGERALPHNFPRRNRLIAALSRAVVVVEASVRSGALITVDHALDLGRDVFAVPGPIDRAQSAGTNAMIQDGARLVIGAQDILDELGVERVKKSPAGRATLPTELPVPLSGDARSLWDTLDVEPRHVDELAVAAHLAAGRALAALCDLELAGCAVQHAGKRFSRAPAFAVS